MKLTIKRTSGASLDVGLISHVERRMEFALGRFSHHVQQVKLGLSDESSPQGETEKRCRLELLLIDKEPLVVSELAVDEYAAVNRAFAVMALLATRRVDRQPRERAEGIPVYG
ncbi:MAG: hypothetical protein CGU28_09155 [Candidatus Dactylopiibacterium carminicum]|uniref:30S ribosomal protein S30 n=1 Tax=Candidatus Dactylopiibacterium carminicum TaxID=857335 RepID=A0A272ET03_9RHOO|nr:hypothetical protein [Candidatus Dactylopiibacterium carminicum]KAF7598954.1 hypothetical protein BGI27_10450 [Candidatus Dactylopiibacterium carminicum]PAS92860.1 MAG: hypothetical protein CGU29_09945 [Candidatus Dactylopiibacterium carminicum]PAS96364.1 MAG: hypothetical protein CGU28_09155 [Candidatus Dactylopiibacterium carminicum]PAS98970.1 MAG: hypothetical protein BSR46_10475 [Candidatus Dactylopiibacterium carminicum]